MTEKSEGSGAPPLAPPTDAEWNGEEDWGDGYCERCDGSGEINRCWDDMCAGQDECLHGDGMVVCAGCDGTGYPRRVHSGGPRAAPSAATDKEG